MKRKSISVLAIALLAVAMTFLFTGCNDEDEVAEVQPEEQIDYEIALITDDSLINDGGSSEVAWNAITDFGATHGISHKYYKAADSSDSSYKEAIDTAVDKGAKVIVADESTIANAVYDMQEKYPEVKFIMLNANPYNDETGDILIGENTASVVFATEQAGYLAGYAAVKEGYTQLGFIGENQQKNVRNYAYGFIKGANRAAREEGVGVGIKYHFCKDASATQEAEKTADKWYKSGTQVIFTCGHKIENMVIESAENNDGKVIGGLTDKGQMSETVIVSAVENIDLAINDMLQAYVDDKFPGGEVTVYNAANSGISLELKNSRLENMDVSEYDNLLDALAKGDVKVRVNKIEKVSDIEVDNVTIIKSDK